MKMFIFSVMICLMCSCEAPKNIHSDWSDLIKGSWVLVSENIPRRLDIKQNEMIVETPFDTMFVYGYKLTGNDLLFIDRNGVVTDNRILKLTRDSLVFEALLKEVKSQKYEALVQTLLPQRYIRRSCSNRSCSNRHQLDHVSDTDLAPAFAGARSPYAFDGQKRSPEISATAQTAQFWEYNGDVGRRWNLDPKPAIGVSQYSTFYDNPIWHTDIFGDTTVYFNSTGTVLLRTTEKDKALGNVITVIPDANLKKFDSTVATLTVGKTDLSATASVKALRSSGISYDIAGVFKFVDNNPHSHLKEVEEQENQVKMMVEPIIQQRETTIQSTKMKQ